MSSGIPARPDPLAEYQIRLEQRRRLEAGKARLDARLAGFRLVVFAAAAAVAWLSAWSGRISTWWILLPVAAFLTLIVLHERARRARQRLARAAAFYEQGIARIEDRWTGGGEQGTRFADPSHPYSEDIDLFGPGSLFELLCTARTRAGEDTLAGWLKNAAGIDEVRSRQQAVEELRLRLDLREDLAVLGSDVRSGVDPDALSAWGTAPPVLVSQLLRIVAVVLALLSAAGATMWAVSGSTLWFVAGAAPAGIFALWLRPRVRHILDAVERPGRDLSLLASVLGRLEREEFHTSRIAALRRALDTAGHPASAQIARLNRLIVLLDSRRNQLFAPIGALLLWGTQIALAIELWRSRTGPAVKQWLAAVGEIETLCALAGFAYEHPSDPFPELVEEGPCYEGIGLGHPLLGESRTVRNDVSLCRDPQVLLVSGSNMSGKSTLLRTVGTNAVLALAGAPVRARRLRLSGLTVGASIRITDSLQEGSSRFYTEIKRLRQLVDLTKGPRPLLFLLDELLHGTNSHDRRIGAEAIVKGLVERGAIGLLTTHDLALSHIAETLAPRAANVHFEDHIENGKIAFDYRLRPGVVRRSNALELMRSVGLEV